MISVLLNQAHIRAALSTAVMPVFFGFINVFLDSSVLGFGIHCFTLTSVIFHFLLTFLTVIEKS